MELENINISNFGEYLNDKLTKKGFNIIGGIAEDSDYYDDYIILIDKKYYVIVYSKNTSNIYKFAIFNFTNQQHIEIFNYFYKEYKNNSIIKSIDDNEFIEHMIYLYENGRYISNTPLFSSTFDSNLTNKEKFIFIMKSVLQYIKN